MPRGKLTIATVKTTLPGAKDVFVWDPELRGFGLKVTPRGAKTYVLQYRTGGRGAPTKRYTIGRHGSPWTPTTARDEAERLLLLVKQGKDPQAIERQRKRDYVDLRFETYAEQYLSQYGKRWSSRTRPTVESNFKNWIVPPLKGKALTAIRKSDIVHMMDRIEQLAPDRAALPRNVFAHSRKLFSWALSRGDIDQHPFAGLDPPMASASRDRVLTDEELNLVWRASRKLGKPFGPIIRLLMITGQRREEVASLDWRELDRDIQAWVIPAERAKNRKSHTVPLSPLAIDVIDELVGSTVWPRRGLVFSTTGSTPVSGHSRAKDRLDREMLKIARKEDGEDPQVDDVTLEPWRVHDLRRTFATGLQRLGVRLEVTEACLNHVSGTRRGIVGVYQRHQWTHEKRLAMSAWSEHLGRLVAPS